jgi:hypothetical protein
MQILEHVSEARQQLRSLALRFSPRAATERSRPVAMMIVVALAFLVSFGFAPSAFGRGRPVVIGEVSSKVTRTGVDYASLLRTTSESELGELDLSSLKSDTSVIASVSLVRLDTLAETKSTDTTCVVSVALRESQGGSIFAILEGRARAKSGQPATAVERSAVQGAIHGALARIPEALTLKR